METYCNKNIKIDRWYGRFGNNIVQLIRAMHISLFYHCNLIIPPHKFFNSTYIKIYDDIDKNAPNISNELQPVTYFFAGAKNVDKKIWKSRKGKKIIEILKKYFIPKPIHLHENDLVIHIRGGDIFGPFGGHPGYIQPPLSYYTNIIKNNEFNDIYICSEDTKNPCINRLLKSFPKIKFQLRPFNIDLSLMLGATNLLMSFTTTASSVLIFSDKINTIYKPSFGFKCVIDYSKDVRYHTIQLNEYKKLMKPWKNTPKQIHTMLTYE